MVLSPSPFRKPRETAAGQGGADFRGTCKIPQSACSRARLIIPALTEELILSRAQRAPREGAVLFADSAEFCKYLFGLRGALWARHSCRYSWFLPPETLPAGTVRCSAESNESKFRGVPAQSAPSPVTRGAGSNLQAAWVVGLRKG